jgi:hypothetical protein
MMTGFDHYTMRRAISIIALAALAGCANETQSGTRGPAGTGGTAGVGGSSTGGEFPTEGPYSTLRVDTANFVYFLPDDLELEATWPSLVWFNGASGYTEDYNYNGLLESIASWGFVVIGGKHPGMNPPDTDQRTELLRRNGDADDALFGRIDEGRIAVAGHSLGGFNTTKVSEQYRVAIAIQGAGTPEGSEAAPTLFMTSEGDETVPSSAVVTAFERAINDAWLANHATADHEDPRIDGGVYREPVIAFLRWRLREDPEGEGWFAGDSCTLCTDPSWSYDRR